VFDAINASTTVVLAAFAFVELWASRSQRRENLKAAHGAVWVEYWRVWTVSENWRREDLENLVRLGIFDPEEILTPDYGALLPLLGALGQLPARLGGAAFAIAANGATQGRLLRRLVEERDAQWSEGAGTKAEEIQKKFAKPIADAQRAARKNAREAATILEDALEAVPGWLKVMQIDLSVAKSNFGKRTHEQLQPIRDSNRLMLWIKRQLSGPAKRLVKWTESPVITASNRDRAA
jgi:hypothetical protein